MDTTSTLQRYRDFAAERRWSKSRLAREAGLSVNALRNFWSDDWNPTAETMKALDAVVAQPEAA